MIKVFRLAATSLALALALAGAAAAQQSTDATQQPTAAPAASAHALTGVAAWYGAKFNGRRTASGQRFNHLAMTAAHPTLPFGSRVKVTNTKRNRSAVVVINDRGPTTPGRIVDVSHAAAKKLGFVRAGLTDVSIEVLQEGRMKRPRSGR